MTKRASTANRSQYEILLDYHVELGGLLLCSEVDYHFHDTREWNFDRAWPSLRIAYEVDGGNHMAVISKRTGRAVAIGRHTQSEDYTKLKEAVKLGWRVFRFTPEMIKSGEAFATMQDALQPIPFYP